MNTREALLRAALSVQEALAALGVGQEALGKEDALKKAHRKAAMTSHPDRGGTKEAMQRVNEAYDLLVKLQPQADGDSREERKKKAEVALRVVKDGLGTAFDPEAFTKHFAATVGQPFVAKVKDEFRPEYFGGNYSVDAEWRSADGQTVFNAYIWVDLSNVETVRMLGGGSDTFAFEISVRTSILHNRRQAKFAPRAWRHTAAQSVVMNPEDLFPKAKIQKMVAGKEKGRSFSKRDMLLGAEKLLGAEVITTSNQIWLEIPLGDGGILRLFRFVFSDRRSNTKFAGWDCNRVRDKNRKSVLVGNKRSAEESEALLDALVALQKKAQGVTEADQLAALTRDTFESLQRQSAAAASLNLREVTDAPSSSLRFEPEAPSSPGKTTEVEKVYGEILNATADLAARLDDLADLTAKAIHFKGVDHNEKLRLRALRGQIERAGEAILNIGIGIL